MVLGRSGISDSSGSSVDLKRFRARYEIDDRTVEYISCRTMGDSPSASSKKNAVGTSRILAMHRLQRRSCARHAQ
jgi:hypothetical protein